MPQKVMKQGRNGNVGEFRHGMAYEFFFADSTLSSSSAFLEVVRACEKS